MQAKQKCYLLFCTKPKKGRIALASPRVDVCLELFPRIQAVFPHEAIALLHGNSQEAYRYTKLVICTTHQLLKFHQAFDLLIVDEVDSFPFVNNEHLYYGVRNARKEVVCVLNSNAYERIAEAFTAKEVSSQYFASKISSYNYLCHADFGFSRGNVFLAKILKSLHII